MQLGKLDVSQTLQQVGCKTEHNSNQPDQRVTPESQNQPAVRTFASGAATDTYKAISTAHSSHELERLARLMWGAYSEGAISEEDATFLGSYIDRRRPLALTPTPGYARPIGGLADRIGSRFTPRPCRKRLSGDERTQRRHRKRMLGGSSALPEKLRHHYTEGERAVLCVVAGEIKRHGICDLSIDEIGDRAGVRRTTVQNALHEANRLGHVTIALRPRRGANNLPNVVRITSAEWCAWIKRGSSDARKIGSKTSKNVNITKIIDSRMKEAADESIWKRDYAISSDSGLKPAQPEFSTPQL